MITITLMILLALLLIVIVVLGGGVILVILAVTALLLVLGSLTGSIIVPIAGELLMLTWLVKRSKKLKTKTETKKED